MNNMYCSSTKLPAARADGRFTGKFGSIRRPSEKVLFICEDEKTLDDGAFAPNAVAFKAGLTCDLVAARHEGRKRKGSDLHFNPNEGNEDSKGNVGFCDGHAEFMGRKDALRQRNTGNPNPDPIGF